MKNFKYTRFYYTGHQREKCPFMMKIYDIITNNSKTNQNIFQITKFNSAFKHHSSAGMKPALGIIPLINISNF